MITQIHSYKQGNTTVKDTMNFAIDSNYWTFDTTAGKIYQVKNALLDTVYFKLIDGNKKLLTSTDEEFVFGNDTLLINIITNNKLEMQGHYTSPFVKDVLYTLGR